MPTSYRVDLYWLDGCGEGGGGLPAGDEHLAAHFARRDGEHAAAVMVVTADRQPGSSFDTGPNALTFPFDYAQQISGVLTP